MITYLVYTYKGDGEFLIVTLNNLKSIIGDARIVVIDDLHNHMSREHTEIVKSIAEIQYSTHQRNGNLLGIDHTLYHARKMRELAPGDDDIVVKTDPDTLILNTGWVKQFEADKDSKLVGMFKQWINYTMGTYAVKGSILKEYVEDVEKYPSWYQCFEDFEVSSRIYRLTKGDPFAITRKFADGRDGWLMCNYQDMKDHAQLVVRCDVVNGGLFIKNPKAMTNFLSFNKAVIAGRSNKIS